MIKELIDYLTDLSYSHISVSESSYKRQININHQNDTAGFQVIWESDSQLLQKQIVEGINTLNISCDIIAPINEGTVIDLHDESTHIAMDIMEKVTNDLLMEVRDYSIMPLEEYTDDNSAGCRLSIQFVIPKPINLCEWESHFIEKEPVEKKTIELNTGDECTGKKTTTTKKKIKLNPIKLK